MVEGSGFIYQFLKKNVEGVRGQLEVTEGEMRADCAFSRYLL